MCFLFSFVFVFFSPPSDDACNHVREEKNEDACMYDVGISYTSGPDSRRNENPRPKTNALSSKSSKTVGGGSSASGAHKVFRNWRPKDSQKKRKNKSDRPPHSRKVSSKLGYRFLGCVEAGPGLLALLCLGSLQHDTQPCKGQFIARRIYAARSLHAIVPYRRAGHLRLQGPLRLALRLAQRQRRRSVRGAAKPNSPPTLAPYGGAERGGRLDGHECERARPPEGPSELHSRAHLRRRSTTRLRVILALKLALFDRA